MTRPAPCAAPARVARVGTPSHPRVRPLLEVLGDMAGGPTPPPVAPAPDRGQDRLDHLAHAVRPVAARLLTAVVEVLDARRPVNHLAMLADPGVLTALTAGRTARSRRPEGRLRGLRVCAVSPGAVEVAAVVLRGDRARAVAARLERPATSPEGTWRITAVVLG